MEVRQVRDIEYRLLPGSDRKTTDIAIERDGAICVRAPRQMTPEQVDDTVFSKRMWIYRNLRRVARPQRRPRGARMVERVAHYASKVGLQAGAI